MHFAKELVPRGDYDSTAWKELASYLSDESMVQLLGSRAILSKHQALSVVVRLCGSKGSTRCSGDTVARG
jgi:hypothetical protein